MVPLWLICILHLCASEKSSNCTLSWHLSGSLWLWITSLALNQHQRAQSFSVKVKPSQRELLLHVPYGVLLGFLWNLGMKIQSKKAGLAWTLVHQLSHIKTKSLISIIYVANLPLQDSVVCLYMRRCLLFCDLHQSSPVLLLQKRMTVHGSSRGCVVQCHVETELSLTADASSNGFFANIKGTSLHCVSHQTSLVRFTSDSGRCFKQNQWWVSS